MSNAAVVWPEPLVSTPKARSLADLAQRFAAREPERALFRFLHLDAEETLTLAALDRRARAGALALSRRGVKSGDRVLLLFPQGLDFLVGFMSCVYLGAVAVTNPFPTRPLARILPRLRTIVEDCEPSLVLSSLDAGDSLAEELIRQIAGLKTLGWLRQGSIPELVEGEPCLLPAIDPEAIAVLQYTSGSTCMPRGVAVSHRNVLTNCSAMAQPAGSRIVSWLPQFHDFGLIYAILLPLIAEVDSVLLSPAAFLQRPVRWLEAISQFRGTHSPAPNFAFELCTRSVSKEQRASLDLSSWEAAIIGAEPIRKPTLERFLAAFADCGVKPSLFLPAYGLAEATLMVTRRPQGAPICTLDFGAGSKVPAEHTASRLVSCGKPYADTRVIIVEPEARTHCAEGELGEIWVSGSAVASGYFRRAEESAVTFGAFTANGEGPFLRTGDLGLLRAGELFVAGRRKELIIANGVNYYPQDIEATVEHSDSEVAPAAVVAFANEVDENAEVVVICELSRAALQGGNTAELAARIRAIVSREHGLALSAIEFVAPGAIPKTTSGKLRRLEARARYLSGELRTQAARAKPASAPASSAAPLPPSSPAPLVEQLGRLAAALLRRNPAPVFSEGTVLGEAGLDSVMFAELGAELEARYGVKVPLQDLFGLSVGQLAARVTVESALSPNAPIKAEAVTDWGALISDVQVAEPARPVVRGTTRRELDFTLFCFGDLGASAGRSYELILDSARLADRLGFSAMWLPERHFHPFGGISPNPTVLAAALSQVTDRLRLRAGSVILPLHHPVRVAEEWALIDNLSAGRVDLAFGWGWNPNDFVFAPEKYAERRALTLSGIQAIERLWRGGKAKAPNGQGVLTEFQLYPRPLQPELPVWLTCTRSTEAFITAGSLGYNVLTALLFQSVDELRGNIALYRAARARNGHDPDAGVVTLMLHTLVGSDKEQVRELVRKPFSNYLHSSRTLWRQGAASLEQLSEAQRETTLGNAFERYFDTAALFGTPRSCLPLVESLVKAGVGEIACLIDFGVEAARVLEGLHAIEELRRLALLEPQQELSHAG
jgi:natural product biosynthesis luciferase-like monooxygenase protein